MPFLIIAQHRQILSNISYMSATPTPPHLHQGLVGQGPEGSLQGLDLLRLHLELVLQLLPELALLAEPFQIQI